MGSIKGWFVMSYVVCTTCYWLSDVPARGPNRGPQRCWCEEQVKQQYVSLDCPSGFHLCYICATTVVGGTSRWSWEACDFCRRVNGSTQKEFGFGLALGRHSIMNGISIPLQEKLKADDQRVVDLMNFANFSVTLSDWGILRARQLVLTFTRSPVAVCWTDGLVAWLGGWLGGGSSLTFYTGVNRLRQ